MSENSAIQWTDATFNPWIGCTKVSPGCKNCYAETLDKMRFSKTLGNGTKDAPVSHWGKGAPRHRTSASNWKQPLKWNKQWGKDNWPYRRGDKGPITHNPRVFCASLADWLDDEVPIEWLADLLDLIRKTPNLDWQLLTKRPENWRTRISAVLVQNANNSDFCDTYNWLADWEMADIAPTNVWIGTTVENQAMADKRIPELLKIPAKVRFLSCEPLLGKVDLGFVKLTAHPKPNIYQMVNGMNAPSRTVDWVITGAESGPGCRPAEIEWFRSLKDQCAVAHVPFFMKQLGGVRDHRGNMEDFPEDLRVREFPTGKVEA